ncbi:hypothetical protein [Sphingomonas qomolangmaensis]|uniref:Uncharacterized protein n=1 Tax=Sphingomonas qomolangmaensis TaxID=2918765 RepID=A0ABY5L8K0_9SPHN|nr:hypothetical protein [Sphingomonas qomolangmaensis]UUL83300.1 hypothetical protein NMP03_03445 [Sphingomonas qomolangmaensis]
MGRRRVKGIASILLAIVVGIVLLWLAIQLLVGVIKLVGVLIAGIIAVAVYFFAEKAIGKGR